MDRFEAMSILVASVEAGSFSAAGRKLGMLLPTISRKVAELEAHLPARAHHAQAGVDRGGATCRV
jgi:DNA-binding transcriptional LysR family regulator